MTDARAASGLDELAALGPFFAVRSHLPGAAPVAPWRPGSELGGPSEPLAARIDAVRAALTRGGGSRDAGEVEPRVAGSVAHLGLTARLIAPALGAAVLRCPLDLRLAGLWWQDELGGALPLSVPAPTRTQLDATALEPTGRERRGPADGGAGQARGGQAQGGQARGDQARGDQARRDQAGGDLGWERVLLDETIAPLTAAVARLVTVSSRVLWGNVASAVNTAAVQVAGQRPDLAPEAWRAAGCLLADPRLRGEPCPPGPRFRRSSCCLFYCLTPGEPAAICGDCVLGPRGAR